RPRPCSSQIANRIFLIFPALRLPCFAVIPWEAVRAFGKNDGKREKYGTFFIFSERSKGLQSPQETLAFATYPRRPLCPSGAGTIARSPNSGLQQETAIARAGFLVQGKW